MERLKPSRVFEMPAIAEDGEVVSRREIEFFVDHGFLVKRCLLDPRAIEAALDRIWGHLLAVVPMDEATAASLSPADPTTWRDPGWGSMSEPPASGPYQGRQPVVHSRATVKLHDLGAADFLVDLLPNNPLVREVATVMLGDLRPSERTRGVYAVFPTTVGDDEPGQARRGATALGPHTDQVCQQLNACAYLADVGPRHGGFTVYPGSHRIMFRAHRYAANWSPLPHFRDAVQRVVDEIQPYEVVGNAGDVIFWHGRTVHSAGIHIGDDIRWAVFADFTRDLETLDAEAHKAAGQFEWFKDARLFRHDALAGDDMWQNWALGGAEPEPCDRPAGTHLWSRTNVVETVDGVAVLQCLEPREPGVRGHASGDVLAETERAESGAVGRR